jgi:hypothetical protein
MITEKTTLKKQYTCDICGLSSDHQMSKCKICRKDLCNNFGCYKYDQNDDFFRYCPTCYKIKFVKYEKELEQIEKGYRNALDCLENKVRRKSRRQNEVM